MNRDLIAFNENNGIVIDEVGNPTIISKEHDNCSLKEILERENTLETLNNDLASANNEHDIIKNRIRLGKRSNIGILLLTLFMVGMCLNTSTPIQETFIICGGFTAFSKLLSVSVSGLGIINKKKIKELEREINELETEIVKQEKELSDVKEKAKYTTISNTSSKKDYQELTFDNMYAHNEEKYLGKVKVLKLTTNR